MPHDMPLITTLVVGISLAFLFGALAQRLRFPPLVGYLLAGVAVGPHTPGFIGNAPMALQLSEIGVILLMFGVGLHFSLKDLLSVRAIAIPGAIGQILIATLLGMGLAHLLGWSMGAGIVFGLALSVASTVVLLRALQERRLLDTERGRIAMGWLIVEDIVMVLTLVLIPALAPVLMDGPADAPAAMVDTGALTRTILITIGKISAFVAVMLLVGRRVIPWILHYTAHTGSRELFRLAVLTIALGVAYGAAQLFDVSFALGAFFAGMILSESELSQQAAAESLPLRDAFAVLFFVAVGMLFDPGILLRQPLPVLATLLIITFGKSLAAFLIVRFFGHPLETGIMISASLAQIGEFSFILAGLGVTLGLLPPEGRDLILAGAILSILLNPLAFYLIDRLRPLLEKQDRLRALHDKKESGRENMRETAPPPKTTGLTRHAVLIGYGKVGTLLGEALQAARLPLLVIEESDTRIERLEEKKIEYIKGNAATSDVLRAAGVPRASWLFIAAPNNFEAGLAIEKARRLNPDLRIIARAYSEEDASYLSSRGANTIVSGDHETARAMVENALQHAS
jgi:CPA2 family monovalent cation:H+ antiporter-2